MPSQRTPQLLACRITRQAGHAQLELTLSAATSYRVFALHSPSRLVVDLQNASGAVRAAALDLAGTPIKAVRQGRHDDALRLVFELTRDITPTAKAGNAAGSFLITIPLAGTGSAVLAAAPALRRARITIDPGHGGKDPGAISASARYEKEVVLSIAHKLRDQISRDDRFEASLTRDDDHFIPLRDRVYLAHTQTADLFVSIHADAAPNTAAQGASVYVLSKDGATSAMANWLADSENSADRFAPARDSALYSPDPMLSKVLVDMSMDATIGASLDLGHLMVANLGQVTRIHQQVVDQAGFAVLKSPDIPSILVETGFMSNRDDCQRLLSEHHQDELALSLQQGIVDYFTRYPLRERG